MELCIKKNESKSTLKATKERIVEAKRKCLEVIECLTETSVSEELLVSSCNFLNQADYLSVIEERNVLHLCGYPLCPKKLKLVKQKYHISLKTNKVYDITERKCFCSNTCYKASNFLKAQLCTIPIWLKEEEDAEGGEPVKLLCTSQNSGSSGEEVDLGYTKMTNKDIERVPVEANENSGDRHKLHIPEDLGSCTAALEKLGIPERCTYSVNTDSLESTLVISDENVQDGGLDDVSSSLKSEEDNISLIMKLCEKKVNSSEQPVAQYSHLDSDDDEQVEEEEECDELLLDHKRYESLISNDKYMPVIPKEKSRKAVLIDPIGNPEKVSRLPLATEKAVDSLKLIQNTLMTWITAETYRFLLGEKFQPMKNKIVESIVTVPSAELGANLCHENAQEEKITDSVEALAQLKLSMFYKGEMGPSETASPDNKTNSMKKTKPTPRRSKKVNSEMLQKKMKEMVPFTPSASREINVLPVVESLSQDTLRRQIVAHQLKLVYEGILPLIGLHYCDISENFQLLLSTFSLSSQNITFKPSEWKMIAVVLFRMIEKKLTTEKKWEREAYWQLLDEKLTSFCISLDQIDCILASVIDHCHFKKLLVGC